MMNRINFKDMEAKHTFQIESTVIDATISEVEKVVPIWAKNKGKSLTVLIYMGNKWQLYKVFTA
jgi:hypothetical protein